MDIAAIVAALTIGMATAAGLANGDSVVAIRGGAIMPVTAPPIEDGVVLIRNGKIEAVGRDVKVPDGAEVMDAAGKVIIPAMIDAGAGLAGERDDEESVTPDIRAIDAFDFYGEYRRFLAGGVATVYISPGRRRLISGIGAVAKLAGRAATERGLAPESALRVTLGEWPKGPPSLLHPPIPPDPDNPLLPAVKQLPTTRMAELAVLRGVFTQARLDSKKPPHAINSKTKVLLRALRRELPVRVNCHNAQDIRSAISFAKAFDLKLIIEGASEAYRALDAIQGSSTPVVLSGVMPPGRRDPRDYTRDLAFGRIHPANAAIVAKAGVPLAISAPSNETAGDLLFVAGHAITYGLSPEQALRAVTIAPAEILGVADRVGSIEKGKDADLVILTGPPFDIQSVVDRTIVDGQTAYARPSGGPQPAREQPTLAVRAGRVFAGRQGVIRNGLILVKDSKITYVGPPKNVPPGTAVLHAGDGVVIPGMIDIHSHLGLHLDSEPARLDPGPATTGPRSDRLNLASIVQAIAPGDEAFREALCCGVTCVLLAPETAPPASGGAVRTFRGRMLRMEPAPQTAPMVSGNAALIKTAGDSMADVVVKEYAAVKFSMLGEGQRPARIWEARSLLKRAKEYAEKWEQYDRQHREFQRRLSTTPAADVKEPDRPDRDVAMELLRGLFQRKMPAMVHANRADEILSTLQVFRDEYNLDLIILGGDDSFRVIQDLKKYRVPVAIGPDILRYEKGKPINNADILVKNGLRVAFHTSATSGTQYLPANAAYAVRYGMDRYEALRAITTRPAELLNVDDRVGSIDVGKDADLVILSGEPFEFASRVEKVIVNGRVAFDSQ